MGYIFLGPARPKIWVNGLIHYPDSSLIDENCFFDIKNFTLTQVNYVRANNGS